MDYNQNGFFVVIEGVDGAGKTTQAKLLRESLEEEGFGAVLTREPGGTPLAEKLRTLLLELESPTMHSPEIMTLLMNAARRDHVEKVIRPALEQRYIVISDRFTPSTQAYQGAGGTTLSDEISPEKVDSVNRFTVGETEPDLTILLNISAEESLKRKPQDFGYDYDQLCRVVYQYREMHKWSIREWLLIDGELSIEVIQRRIFSHVCSMLSTAMYRILLQKVDKNP